MKTNKLILLGLLILTAPFAQAQKWTPYKIDDSVQVSLPADHHITDTLGQTIINGSTACGLLCPIRILFFA